MFWNQGLDGLDLYNDLTGNDQICVELSDRLATKTDLDRNLPLDLQSLGSQRHEQGTLVYRLEESDTQLIGNLKSGLQNPAC